MRRLTWICLVAGIVYGQETTALAQSAGMTRPPEPSVAWTYTTSAPINSSPIIAGGSVFFGGFDSMFYSLDLSSGRVLWSFKTRGQIRSTATLDGQHLLFVSGDGNLYCLDQKSGRQVWRFATRGEQQQDFADYFQSSPVVSGDIVYFGSGDGSIYAVRASDGSMLWSHQTSGVVHATPAVADGKLFVGSFDGYFYALNALDGSLLWKFKSVGQQWFPRGEFQGSPAMGEGIVVVGSRDYNLYALDVERGYCRWNKRFTRGWALANQIDDSILYTGTSDDRVLIATEVASGRELWRTNLHFNIFGGLAISGTTGFVGTLLGKLYAIDLQTGAEVWSFATDGYKVNRLKYFKEDDSFRDDIFEIVKSDAAFIDVEHEIGAIFSTPAVAGGYIVITSTDGSVYCLRR